MNTKSKFVGFLLILAACLSTALLLHYHNNQQYTQATPQPKDPNLIVENTTFTNFNSNGLLHIHLLAPKATHYPGKNTTAIIKPKLIIYSNNRTKWIITANNGLAREGNKSVILWGQVIILQPKEGSSPKTKITTKQITFYPNRSYADTDQYVTIQRANAMLKAKGMSIDFKQGTLITKSKTHASYESQSQ